MKRFVTLSLICALTAATAFTQGLNAEGKLGPSGGIGLGYTGILTSAGWISLGVLDLRLGGYFECDFARVGPGALGAEIGAWAFVIPAASNWLLLSEFPLTLDYGIGIAGGWQLTAQLGYALTVDNGEDMGFYHCQVTGLRASKGHFFGELAAYIPFAASGDFALSSFALWPHAEIGYRF
jgi:hypothetical protein